MTSAWGLIGRASKRWLGAPTAQKAGSAAWSMPTPSPTSSAWALLHNMRVCCSVRSQKHTALLQRGSFAEARGSGCFTPCVCFVR